MQGDILIATWDVDDEAARHAASRIKEMLLRELHIEIIHADGLIMAVGGQRVENVAPGIYLFGDLFCDTGLADQWPRPERWDAPGFVHYCRGLLSNHWGSYLVVRHDPLARAHLSVFAEPIGSRECSSWVHGNIRFLAWNAERWLYRFPPADLCLDHAELAHIIHYPGQAHETQPIAGISTLQPGAITHMDRSGMASERLWTPRDHAGQYQSSPDVADLRRMIDHCTGSWASIAGTAVLELSGGLDSAIVASALHEAGAEPIAAFTFFGDSLAGDERRFSRATATMLGLDAREIPLVPTGMDEEMLTGIALGMRPGVGSTTFFHDQPLALAGRALGADSLFTGRGGDALFFQHPTPIVAAEPWPQGDHRNLDRLEMLARWCQCSIWSAAWQAFMPRLAQRPAASAQNPFSPLRLHPRPSSWAGPLDGLPLGKQMQIEAIAGERNAFGPSRCAQAMQVVHPLLSQPIVEFALGQPLMTLTQGRRDRAMAREAFAARLPPALIERRGKGSLSAFFGQTLARSTDLLKAQLLEGALRQTGLIDPAALEQALAPEYLIQVDCYGEILRLLVIERWMRAWHARLNAAPLPRARPERQDFPRESELPGHRNRAGWQGSR